MQSAVKIVIRARGKKLCARIMWLPIGVYRRMSKKCLQSGKVRLA